MRAAGPVDGGLAATFARAEFAQAGEHGGKALVGCFGPFLGGGGDAVDEILGECDDLAALEVPSLGERFEIAGLESPCLEAGARLEVGASFPEEKTGFLDDVLRAVRMGQDGEDVAAKGRTQSLDLTREFGIAKSLPGGRRTSIRLWTRHLGFLIPPDAGS